MNITIRFTYRNLYSKQTSGTWENICHSEIHSNGFIVFIVPYDHDRP